LGKRLRNDLFCVDRDVKPQLNQSISVSYRYTKYRTIALCSLYNIRRAFSNTNKRAHVFLFVMPKKTAVAFVVDTAALYYLEAVISSLFVKVCHVRTYASHALQQCRSCPNVRDVYKNFCYRRRTARLAMSVKNHNR